MGRPFSGCLDDGAERQVLCSRPDLAQYAESLASHACVRVVPWAKVLQCIEYVDGKNRAADELDAADRLAGRPLSGMCQLCRFGEGDLVMLVKAGIVEGVWPKD